MQIATFEKTTDGYCKLAHKIIESADLDRPAVDKICSSEFFYINPIAHIVKVMFSGNDWEKSARVHIIRQIPNFIEKVSKADNLRSLAAYYFHNDPQRLSIIEVFEKSLSSQEFKTDMDNAIKLFHDATKHYAAANNNLEKIKNVVDTALMVCQKGSEPSIALQEYAAKTNQLFQETREKFDAAESALRTTFTIFTRAQKLEHYKNTEVRSMVHFMKAQDINNPANWKF